MTENLSPVLFHSQDSDFSINDEVLIARWIATIVEVEKRSLESLNVIFCSDDYLLQLNKEYLDHDYYTDILTFEYKNDPIEGEIYISIDRITENAQTHQTTFREELNRVIAHGVLHLCGYSDHSDEEKRTMSKKEDFHLGKLSELDIHA